MLLSFCFLLCSLPVCAQQTNAHATYALKPTPKTVAWGHYDAKTPPVLRVKSGDTVEIQTLITNSPERLEKAGVPKDQVEQSLRDITDQVKDKGPGGHILTGPIYIEDAQPGDVLEVKILAIKLAIPYAYNAFGPAAAICPTIIPTQKLKLFRWMKSAWWRNSRRASRFRCIRFLAAWATRRRKAWANGTALRHGLSQAIWITRT